MPRCSAGLADFNLKFQVGSLRTSGVGSSHSGWQLSLPRSAIQRQSRGAQCHGRTVELERFKFKLDVPVSLSDLNCRGKVGSGSESESLSLGVHRVGILVQVALARLD